MSVKVNPGGGSSGSGLSNIMGLYSAYNQVSNMGSGAPKAPAPKDNQGMIDWAGNDSNDPFMDNLDAIQRRQAKMVNPPQPAKSGLSNIMGAVGMAGAFA